MGNQVWGFGFGVLDLGFGVWGLGFEVWGVGFGVWGSGFQFQVFGFTERARPTWRRRERSGAGLFAHEKHPPPRTLQ